MTYHKDVFLPPSLRGLLPSGETDLVYTSHARRQATEDRYGLDSSELPLRFSSADWELVEITPSERKVVVRVPLHDHRSLVLVILYAKYECLVKTLWVNLTSDTHQSLRRENYVQPPA